MKLDLDLQRILNSGAEVAYDERLYYPRWEGPYDLNIPGTRDYAASYGRAVRFRESSIILVDPYEYVANAVKNGFEIIKW